MSELTTRFVDDTYVEYYNTGKHELAQIYLKSEADKVIAEKDKTIARHKYKRCVAMAKYCEAMRGHYLSYEEPKWFWYRKWSERWLELAEKFKPNN